MRARRTSRGPQGRVRGRGRAGRSRPRNRFARTRRSPTTVPPAGDRLSRRLRHPAHLRRLGGGGRLRHRPGPMRGPGDAGFSQPATGYRTPGRNRRRRSLGLGSPHALVECPRDRRAHLGREPAAHTPVPAGLLRWAERLPARTPGRMPRCTGGGTGAGDRPVPLDRCPAVARHRRPSGEDRLEPAGPEFDFPNQSSTWAIGPTRTASGRPMLFIDPHWPAQGDTSWWEFHVHTGR